MSNTKINSWDWDIRVRERNLKNGILTDKDVDKHRSGLTDVAEGCEPVTVAQPAVGTGEAPESSASDVTAEDEDEDEPAEGTGGEPS
jgi:hypothetical protein